MENRGNRGEDTILPSVGGIGLFQESLFDHLLSAKKILYRTGLKLSFKRGI